MDRVELSEEDVKRVLASQVYRYTLGLTLPALTRDSLETMQSALTIGLTRKLNEQLRPEPPSHRCVGVDVATTCTVFVVLWMATTSRIASAMVASRGLCQRAGNGGQQVQVEVAATA
eukprot:COSAG05_NODE_86_length_20511_cov_71.945277_7_plen_117_part_00